MRVTHTGSMKKLLFIAMLVLAAGFLLPTSKPVIPVEGATSKDWHPQSFWYYPWGRSGVHKGIDIFSPHDKPVLAAQDGLVISTGNISMGGNIVLVLGANWRLYYYAHLARIDTPSWTWVTAGERIGTVGDTGNAKGKPPHLHFTIRSLLPLLWQYDNTRPQAWRRLFFIDPDLYLRGQA